MITLFSLVWFGLLTEVSRLKRWMKVGEFRFFGVFFLFLVSPSPPWQTAQYIKQCGSDAGEENGLLEICSLLTHSANHILHQQHSGVLPISHEDKTSSFFLFSFGPVHNTSLFFSAF